METPKPQHTPAHSIQTIESYQLQGTAGKKTYQTVQTAPHYYTALLATTMLRDYFAKNVVFTQQQRSMFFHQFSFLHSLLLRPLFRKFCQV